VTEEVAQCHRNWRGKPPSYPLLVVVREAVARDRSGGGLCYKSTFARDHGPPHGGPLARGGTSQPDGEQLQVHRLPPPGVRHLTPR
jgi:hypothetical protein